MEETKSQFMNKEVENLINQLISNLNINKYTVEVAPATIRGDNFLGVVDKVLVKSEKSTLHWILKCATQIEQFRQICSIPHLFQREVYIYENVLMEFKHFQSEKVITDPFKSYAPYYGSLLHPPHECVVMEDMKELGYKVLDRREPLDYNHILLVTKEYARFHAISFALRDQKPTLFEEITKHTQCVLFNKADKYFVELINGYIDKALVVIDPIVNKSAYDKCLNFKKHSVEIIKNVKKLQATDKYSVICHSDSWINNFLFKYSNPSEPNTPSDLCIIDWQLAHIGSPVSDLTYLLFTCTDKEFRDTHYNYVINYYYNTFSTFLRRLGSDPEELFPFSILQEHLKAFSVFAFYMSLQVLYLMLSNTDEIPDYVNERQLLKAHYTSKNIDTYRSRMRGVVLDFDRFGYEL
ncbi:hypothetical protein RN001_000521 [Aquatica leii]|uniref:CHK kinase-like domain-containing protein n=1 Tax=Aquatica leii TaxID=1421715 RepID=A0AAN7SSG6_9COLE|nr:hypothetical protein RN001_000521 [Aquatica leii]